MLLKAIDTDCRQGYRRTRIENSI